MFEYFQILIYFLGALFVFTLFIGVLTGFENYKIIAASVTFFILQSIQYLELE